MIRQIARFIISIFILISEPFFYILEKMASLNGINGERATLYLRGFIYGLYWGCKGCKIGGGIKFVTPSNFKIGNNVTLHQGGSYIASKKSQIIIGEGTHISRNSILAGSGGIEIGTHCAISSGVIIYSVSNSTADANKLITEQSYYSKVSIGKNVFIGAGVAIIPGITIGDNAVIGANAVVTKSIPANVVAVGNPARVIKDKNRLLKDAEES